MTPEQIYAIVAAGESETLEYKATTGDDHGADPFGHRPRLLPPPARTPPAPKLITSDTEP